MKIPTLINSTSKINGELSFTTDVRIDGEVYGKVESDKSVIVGPEGIVKGFLRATDLVIFGRVEGNLIVSGTTVIHSTASIFGSLYTKVLEVKAGAFIMGRLVTTDKLEAIDEAQIFMAEERLKLEPIRKPVNSVINAEISFDDGSENNLENEILIALSEKEEIIEPNILEDILSAEMEFINSSKDKLIADLTQAIIKSDDTLTRAPIEEAPVEIFEMVDEVVLEPELQELTLPVSSVENFDEIPFVEQVISGGSSVLVISEVVSNEEIEFTSFNLVEAEDQEEDKFVLLMSSEIEPENQIHEIGELKSIEPAAESNQDLLMEFDFEIELDGQKEIELIPNINGLAIVDFFGEPVKIDSTKLRKGRKKTYISEPNLISQVSRKNKNHSISGFEELRNLLSPVKYQEIKLGDKPADDKFPIKKSIDIKNNNKVTETEKGDLFLNNAIRELPTDDYSSLFN